MVAFGILVTFGEKLPIRLGRLPGDIRWEGKNGSFYFPITTSIVVSIVLSAILYLLGR